MNPLRWLWFRWRAWRWLRRAERRRALSFVPLRDDAEDDYDHWLDT